MHYFLKFPWMVKRPKTSVIFLDWSELFQSLSDLQKRIKRTAKNTRKRRNLQRLLCRTRSIQLLVVFRILQHSYSFSRQKISPRWLSYQPDYFKNLQVVDCTKLNSKDFPPGGLEMTYKFFTKRKKQLQSWNQTYPFFYFNHDLWVLCLLPVLEYRLHPANLYSRAGRIGWDAFYILCDRLASSQCQWVTTVKIFTPLNKHNKLQILKHFYLEKKFLLAWFIERNSTPLPDRVTIRSRGSIGFQSLVTAWLVNPILEYLNSRGYQTLFYAHVLLIFTPRPLFPVTKTSLTPMIFNQNLQQFTKEFLWSQELVAAVFKKGVYTKINAIQTTRVDKGFDFLGWNFSRQGGKVITKISQSNVRAHCRELNQLLKSSTQRPDEQTIIQMNKKIRNWQYYYSCAQNLNETWYFLNRWLFWRLWRWVKKRHNKQGSKWLYARYWTIERFSTSQTFKGNSQANYYSWCFRTHGVRVLQYNQSKIIHSHRSDKGNIFDISLKNRHNREATG